MVKRPSLRMTNEELEEFLRSKRIGLVSGHQSDGVLTSRRVLYSSDGPCLVLDVQPAERCFDLCNSPELCFVVDEYPAYEAIKSVIVHGPGTWLADGPARIRMEMHRIVSFDFRKQR